MWHWFFSPATELWSGRHSRWPTSRSLHWSGDAAQGFWEKSVVKVSFQSVFFYVNQLLKHCRVDCGPSFQWTEMKRVCSHLCLFSSFAHILHAIWLYHVGGVFGNLQFVLLCRSFPFEIFANLFSLKIESLFWITFRKPVCNKKQLKGILPSVV